jgi:hypothetical protein
MLLRRYELVAKRFQPKSLRIQMQFGIKSFLFRFLILSFYKIPSNQIQSNLQISIWDKKLIRSEFLGFVEFPLAELLEKDYEDSENDSLWYPLANRTPKEGITGDVLVKIGTVSPMSQDMRVITRSLRELQIHRNASLISTDDPSDMLFFNVYASFNFVACH